jgi:hypothetical protein
MSRRKKIAELMRTFDDYPERIRSKPYTAEEIGDWLNLSQSVGSREVNFSDLCRYYVDLLEDVAKLRKLVKTRKCHENDGSDLSNRPGSG